MTKAQNKIIAKNTISLIIFNVAKIVFPFVTLPYLTNVLSTESYGIVAYVKTIMSYMQIFVDFGFILSATKDIVRAKQDNKKIGNIVYDTMVARIILGLIGFILITILSIFMPLLRDNYLYTLLSYTSIFLSIFLMDFLFRGLEIMQFITIRFVLMKTISLILTFLFIKNDSNILLIPIFDIISSMLAAIFVFFKVRKLKLSLKFSGFKKIWNIIKDSFTYFMSNVAATSFNAIGTIIIGFTMSLTDVAIWSVCMQILGSIQACYTPISDGIYPEIIKTKDIGILKRMVKLFLPLVIVGSVILFFASPLAFQILGKTEYLSAVPIFRILIGAVFFGFFAILYGWPALGPIEKQKQVTISTWISVISFFVIIGLLTLLNKLTLISLAISRVIAEIILFILRYITYRKYKNLYS